MPRCLVRFGWRSVCSVGPVVESDRERERNGPFTSLGFDWYEFRPTSREGVIFKYWTLLEVLTANSLTAVGGVHIGRFRKMAHDIYFLLNHSLVFHEY